MLISEDPLADETLYFQNDEPRWKITAESDEQFLFHVPKIDPYYLEREIDVMGGGDIRLLNISIDRGTGEREGFTWAMSADLGLRWRPVRENVALVLESRFLNGPQNSEIDDLFSEARVRSGYLLIDDLMYNSHFMAGVYRPMFGHYNADHEGLLPALSGLNQRAVFKGIGFGTAPNVPYLTLHYLDPGLSRTVNQDKGFVANLGARFVSYGLSGQLSYWQTTNDASGVELERKMISISGGASHKRFTALFEYLIVEKEFAVGSIDRGAAYWAELKYRIWRQTYAQLNYGASNVARTLKEGSGTELIVGAKAFILNGIELDLLLINRKDIVGTTEVSSSLIQTQLHLFF